MKRYFLMLTLATVVISSCGRQHNDAITESAVETCQIEEIVSNPLDYEETTVRFEGTIGHVCRHSGDKMRVFQQSDDAFSIMVMLGDFTGSLTTEFEGMSVVATGVVKAEVRNIDQLAQHDHDDDHDHDHECSSTQEAIARLQERGIAPDIRTYVQLTGFEIK